jgi:hypothetical protein
MGQNRHLIEYAGVVLLCSPPYSPAMPDKKAILHCDFFTNAIREEIN